MISLVDRRRKLNKDLNIERCGICDNEIADIDKAIWGTVKAQTFYEPSQHAYICIKCQKREKQFDDVMEKIWKEEGLK